IPYTLIGSILWILVFLIFLLIWIIDYRHYIIPDGLVILLAVLGAGNVILKFIYGQFGIISGSFLGSYAFLFGLRDSVWFNHFFAALAAALIFGLIILMTKGKGMGAGDLKLIVALGILFGWPDIIFVIIFSFFIGSLASLGLLIYKKKTLKSRIPFAPFIILGSLVLIFFGRDILAVYFNFFRIF
ncbi:MAG: A24 family peptidase, partial [Patescibacteria group bacterium]